MSERLDEQQLEAIEVSARMGRGVPGHDVCELLAEVRALRAERDRLRDGIAWLTESYHPPEVVESVLRSLLDGEADDE